MELAAPRRSWSLPCRYGLLSSWDVRCHIAAHGCPKKQNEIQCSAFSCDVVRDRAPHSILSAVRPRFGASAALGYFLVSLHVTEARRRAQQRTKMYDAAVRGKCQRLTACSGEFAAFSGCSLLSERTLNVGEWLAAPVPLSIRLISGRNSASEPGQGFRAPCGTRARVRGSHLARMTHYRHR